MTKWRICIGCGKGFNPKLSSYKRCKKCYNKWSNRTKKKRKRKDYL